MELVIRRVHRIRLTLYRIKVIISEFPFLFPTYDVQNLGRIIG